MSVTGKVNHPENQLGQSEHQALLDEQKSLAEENAELKQQLIKLEEREQANAEILATVSHEIRTPIGAIMTMVELLQTTNLNTNQHHYAQTLQLAAKNLSTLTTDILNFARLEAGHVELEEEIFNLKEFLETMTSSIKPRALDKGLRFDCQLDEECPKVIKGDQVRLSQIINNLANNALKFTEEGSLKLQISSSEIRDEKSSAQYHLIRVELKDTGIGISQAEQEKIFTPFCQANSSIQTKFGGSGLGLYISRTLAEQMGGKLDYKSQKECGSTFWFTFKCEEVTDQSDEVEEETEEAEPLINAHALIVEDNPLNQMLIKTYLDQFGVTYDCVANGQLALNIIQNGANEKSGLNKNYDLILMDIMMPVMDGITATKELHKLWASQGCESQASQTPIPILALTANALDDQVREYYKAGVDGYVSKPIRGADLYDAIEALFQKTDMKKTISA
ncbi:MAG: ATP-binding protein [Rhodomicrobiaceae bacterium]